MRIGWNILFLTGLAAVAAGTSNLVRPESARLPWVQAAEERAQDRVTAEGFPVVNVSAVAEAIDAGRFVMIFDARPLAEYDLGHLPTAVPLPEQQFAQELTTYSGFLQKSDPVLVYCGSTACDASLVVARKLRDQGYTDVTVFVEGFSAWQAAGREVE